MNKFYSKSKLEVMNNLFINSIINNNNSDNNNLFDIYKYNLFYFYNFINNIF